MVALIDSRPTADLGPRATVRSPDVGWDGVSLCGYAYSGFDAPVAMRLCRGRLPVRQHVDAATCLQRLDG